MSRQRKQNAKPMLSRLMPRAITRTLDYALLLCTQAELILVLRQQSKHPASTHVIKRELRKEFTSAHYQRVPRQAS